VSEVEPLDLLAGAAEIAMFMRLSRRQIYHLVETSRLPVFRLGTQLCARRSTLLRWIEDMERATGSR
jgi:excisionase family DNA binding protein